MIEKCLYYYLDLHSFLLLGTSPLIYTQEISYTIPARIRDCLWLPRREEEPQYEFKYICTLCFLSLNGNYVYYDLYNLQIHLSHAKDRIAEIYDLEHTSKRKRYDCSTNQQRHLRNCNQMLYLSKTILLPQEIPQKEDLILHQNTSAKLACLCEKLMIN